MHVGEYHIIVQGCLFPADCALMIMTIEVMDLGVKNGIGSEIWVKIGWLSYRNSIHYFHAILQINSQGRTEKILSDRNKKEQATAF